MWFTVMYSADSLYMSMYNLSFHIARTTVLTCVGGICILLCMLNPWTLVVYFSFTYVIVIVIVYVYIHMYVSVDKEFMAIQNVTII